MTIENWNIQELAGYVPQTTFYTDFSIAEKFGKAAIQDTYDRAFKEWKTNVKFVTELCMVLNWKLWRWYEHNDEYFELYNKLWEELDNWCLDNLKGDDLVYYTRTTD